MVKVIKFFPQCSEHQKPLVYNYILGWVCKCVTMPNATLTDARGLDPKRFRQGSRYIVVGPLTGSNCVIIERDDKGERCAIVGSRLVMDA